MSLVSDLIRWATYAAIIGAFAFAAWRLYKEFRVFFEGRNVTSQPEEEKKKASMYCVTCRARMYEYHVDPRFLEGEFFYCGDYPEDHPWVWVKKNGMVVWKE